MERGESVLLYSNQKNKSVLFEQNIKENTINKHRKCLIKEERHLKKFSTNKENITSIYEDTDNCAISESLIQNKESEFSNLSSITPNKNSLQISYNPFEVKPESLQLYSCSPSVFASFENEEKKKSFQWSIDQIAALHPADIDETSQQDSGQTYLDLEMEERAQKAIETFFSQNNVVPSPWGALAKHVTFSPNLASTAYYTNFEESLNNSQVCNSNLKKDEWTQTMLTFPPNVNLMELLAPYFAFKESNSNSYNEIVDESYNETDSLSNTSLRRKLFFHGTDKIHSNSLQKSFSTAKLESPPVTPKSCTHKDSDESHICTPNSSQFSSSPITPYESSLMHSVRITTPTISPIGKSIFKTPSTSSRSEGIEMLPSSSSTEHVKALDKMSFTPTKSSVLLNNDMKGNDSKLEALSIITEIPKLNADAFEHSIADMSCENSLNNNNVCLESSIIENQTDIMKTPNKEISSNSHNNVLQVEPKQVDIQFDSHPSSLAHDTGYQTGSSQYVCLNSQCGLQRYLPNIVGTSDSSNISMPASLQEDLCENIKDQIILPDTHEKLTQNGSDNSNSNFSVTTFIQEKCSSGGFNSLSWKPYQCSTPSKNNICNIQIL